MATVYIAASGVPQEHKAAYSISAIGMRDSIFPLRLEKSSTVQREILKAAAAVIETFILHKDEFKKDSVIIIVSNNGYLLDMWNKGYISKWRASEWIKADGNEITNKEEVKFLDSLVTEAESIGFRVRFVRPSSPQEEAFLKNVSQAATFNRKHKI